MDEGPPTRRQDSGMFTLTSDDERGFPYAATGA